ncbi:MAG: phosphotriesterase family protein [Candidatus Limnocylindrales bacterium]
MTVMTVLGPIPDADLGHVQTHEHVLLDLGRAPYRWDYEGLLDDPVVAGHELLAYRAVGGTTLCELTTPDLGRSAVGLRAAALASGVHIVMGCGWYRGPYYAPDMDRRSTRELANGLVAEIDRGVGDSGIRPGLIGEIGSDKAWLSGLEERAFRAAGQAQARTGLALMTHTPPGGAQAQLDVLAEVGADLRRVAVGHSDGLLDRSYHDLILEAGAYLSFDLVGQSVYPDERRARHLVDLVNAGHLERLLVSTDLCHRSRLHAWGGAGYPFLIESFLPRLLGLGVTEAQVAVLTRDNPRRYLAGA